jgi:hypothetical protein
MKSLTAHLNIGWDSVLEFKTLVWTREISYKTGAEEVVEAN